MATELLHERDLYKIQLALITFGSPRTLDRTLSSKERSANESGLLYSIRFQNYGDIVACLPPRALGFCHVGRPAVYDEESPQKWEVGAPKHVEEEPIDDIGDVIEKIGDTIEGSVKKIEEFVATLNFSHHFLDGETGYISRLEGLLGHMIHHKKRLK